MSDTNNELTNRIDRLIRVAFTPLMKVVKSEKEFEDILVVLNKGIAQSIAHQQAISELKTRINELEGTDTNPFDKDQVVTFVSKHNGESKENRLATLNQQLKELEDNVQ